MRFRLNIHGEPTAAVNDIEAINAAMRLLGRQMVIKSIKNPLGISVITINLLAGCHSPNPPAPTVTQPVASQPAHKPPFPDCTKR